MVEQNTKRLWAAGLVAFSQSLSSVSVLSHLDILFYFLVCYIFYCTLVQCKILQILPLALFLFVFFFTAILIVYTKFENVYSSKQVFDNSLTGLNLMQVARKKFFTSDSFFPFFFFFESCGLCIYSRQHLFSYRPKTCHYYSRNTHAINYDCTSVRNSLCQSRSRVISLQTFFPIHRIVLYKEMEKKNFLDFFLFFLKIG